MKWVEVRVVTTNSAAEAVANRLIESQTPCPGYPAGGVVIEDGTTGADTTVRAFFPASAVTGEFIRGLEAWVRGLGEYGLEPGRAEVTQRIVEDEDWSTGWRAYYHPLKVGKRIVVKPSWEDYRAAGDETVIELDPGMAFGTGSHPTTMLCLEALEDLVSSGDTVFDIGTGSGILAIAAVKLGADRVVAVDLEEAAVEAARQNAARNDVDGRVWVYQGSAADIPGQANLIVANITAAVLSELAVPLAEKLKPGGILVSSGIINEKTDDVERAFTGAGLKVQDRRQKDEWVCLIAAK